MDHPAKTTVHKPAEKEVIAPETITAAAAMEPAAVLQLMRHVADWQLQNPHPRRPQNHWIEATGNLGIMTLAELTGDAHYADALRGISSRMKWGFQPRRYFADNHLIGETYLRLHQIDPKRANIKPLRNLFDGILAKPKVFPSLDFRQPEITDEWSWCDSLFMAPPLWALMGKVTGDSKYTDFMVHNWWRTADFLYDKEEQLYFRDSNYFDRPEANGRKKFWSRGNGWVLGGLMRVLDYLPQDHPARPRFEAHYKEFAARIAGLQQPDGFWHPGLLDPASYPQPETSGTGFFVAGLAWGINSGRLDRATYEPVVRKGWQALVNSVKPSGRVINVQPVGASPGRFDPDSSEPYGVGAFLLAGREIHRMAGGKDPQR